MSELLKSRHAFGSEFNVDSALEQGLIDAYDILFLNEGKIGWIDKNGNKVILENKKQVVTVDTLPETGEFNTVYIYGSKLYFWNGTEFVLSDEVGMTEGEVNTKIDAAVESVIDTANAYTDEKIEATEKIKYEIAYKPENSIVNYRDKEIRIMCPVNTKWALQQSGEGADANKYYIGFKAYAPNEDVVSFKEDLAEIISDNTMYYFEGNDFAGIESDGRKYSIVWLPVAKFDEASNTWTYYGVNSTVDKYIGWYYSVEWYNADGVIVASDCIRINLSNEECYSSIKPFYISNAIKTANDYTDEKIANAISVEVIEF